MSHPLLLLLWLRLRGFVRHRLRASRNPTSMVFFLVGLLLVGICLLGMLFPLLIGRAPRAGVFTNGRSNVNDFVPLLLLLTTVSQGLFGNAKGIAFSPAEVDFLFAAPFRRVQLLGYRVTTFVLGAIANAVFISFGLWPVVRWWPAAWLGAATAVLFVALFTILSSLARERVGLWLSYGRHRWLVVPLAILLIGGFAAGVAQLVSQALAITDFETNWRTLLDTPLLWTLRAPFLIFSRTISAERLFPDLALWGSLAVAADVLMFWMIVRLDIDFLEASIHASQRRQEMIERVRRGKSPVGVWSRWKVTMPRLPWLAGMGPVVWRHGLSNLAGGLATIGVAIALAAILVVVGHYGQHVNIGLAFAAGAYTMPLIAARLQGLFRQELEHIDWLKSLPVRPTAAVIGQLFFPVSVIVIMHWLLLAGIGISGTAPWQWLLLIGLLLLPTDLLIASIEVTFCLLFPTRAAAMNLASVQSLGRQMVLVFMRMVLLGLSIGLAAAIGGVTYWLTGESIVAGVVASWPIVALESLAALAVAIWAWDRFDPSADLPA